MNHRSAICRDQEKIVKFLGDLSFWFWNFCFQKPARQGAWLAMYQLTQFGCRISSVGPLFEISMQG